MFEDTPDQSKANAEVKADMEKNDRWIDWYAEMWF